MKKMKISFAAIAFVMTIGASFASKAFTAGWYVPDATGTYAGTTEPSQCNSDNELCATEYDSNRNVIATAFKD